MRARLLAPRRALPRAGCCPWSPALPAVVSRQEEVRRAVRHARRLRHLRLQHPHAVLRARRAAPPAQTAPARCLLELLLKLPAPPPCSAQVHCRVHPGGLLLRQVERLLDQPLVRDGAAGPCPDQGRPPGARRAPPERRRGGRWSCFYFSSSEPRPRARRGRWRCLARSTTPRPTASVRLLGAPPSAGGGSGRHKIDVCCTSVSPAHASPASV